MFAINLITLLGVGTKTIRRQKDIPKVEQKYFYNVYSEKEVEKDIFTT